MSESQRIVPVLVYEDIETAHAFLVRAFKAEAGPLSRGDDGAVVHGEVSFGGETVWLHRVAAEHGMVSPRSLAASSCGLVVFVDDVDAHHRRAAAPGAPIDYAPADMPYGQREYGARDSEGGRWSFATRLRAPVSKPV